MGSSTVEAFRDRLSDVREAVVSGTRAVADSLPGLPSADGWRLGEVPGSFGISLAAEGEVILTRASAAVTFEVTVTLQRAVTGAADRILLGGQDKGSGFAITNSRALTAGHVVRAAATMVGGRNDDAARPP